MTKGEITHYEQFFLSLQCFQKVFVSKVLESVYVRGKGKLLIMSSFSFSFQCFQKAFVSKVLESVYVRGKGKLNT